MKSVIKFFLKPLIRFIRYVSYNSIPALHRVFLIDFVRDQAIADSATYIQEHIESVMLFDSCESLWDHALMRVNTKGICAEFGVFSGYSINYFSNIHKNRIFHGFDSFEGLREDWRGTGTVKGSFDLKGTLPKVRDNVKLIKGWFSQTVPVFLEQQNGNFAFIHFDADTYESTSYLLDTIGKKIVPGTIIIFDEYLGFPNWKNREFRAWKEFVNRNNIRYQYLSFSVQQAAIEILPS